MVDDGLGNINEFFGRGGKPLLDFLDYCVRSIQMDLVFLFLVREYRDSRTAAKAVALYDMFCAPNAPGRISVGHALPPYDVRLRETIRPLAMNLAQSSTPPLSPPKYLFDSLAGEIELRSPSLHKAREYKPNRTAVENLPGGKMTPVQRHFVEKIWEPIIRPRLVSAGFWRMTTIA